MDDMMDVSVLIDEFLEDANGHVEAVEVALLEMERRWSSGDFDDTLLTLLLGSLHTLKGNSGMMGFTPVQQYVHRLESALKNVRLPVEISSVGIAEDPLHATAKGALIKAMSEGE